MEVKSLNEEIWSLKKEKCIIPLGSQSVVNSEYATIYKKIKINIKRSIETPEIYLKRRGKFVKWHDSQQSLNSTMILVIIMA